MSVENLSDRDLALKALAILRDRASRLLIEMLGAPAQDEAVLRGWVDTLNMKDVVVFAEETLEPYVDDVLLPIFLLDVALARLERDHGLSHAQAEAEYAEFLPVLRAGWARLWEGEVECPQFVITIDGQDHTLDPDPLGRAMDLAEKFYSSRRAT